MKGKKMYWYELRVPEKLVEAIKEIQKVEGKEYNPREFVEPAIKEFLMNYLQKFLLTPQQPKYQKAINYLSSYIIDEFQAKTKERVERAQRVKNEVRQVQKRI